MQQASDARELDLLQLANSILREWKTVIGVVVIAVACAVVYGFVASRIYRSEALIVPTNDYAETTGAGNLVGQLSGLASIVGLGANVGETQTQVSLALLTSRGFLESYIQEEQILPILYASRWDARRQTWRNTNDEVPTIAEAVEYFQRNVLKVNQDRRTGLVHVLVEWSDPDLAAKWANDIVARVNAQTRSAAVAEAKRNQEFLNHELEKSGPIELKQAIYRLQEAQIKKEMLANVRQDYAFKVVDRARAADTDDYVKPKRSALVLFAALVGLIVGIVLALTRRALRASRPSNLST